MAFTSQRSKMNWATRITHALEQGQFKLFCQPMMAINDKDDNCKLQEIHLMMNDEDGNNIPPRKFIPAAEKCGMMVEIDKWVIRTLCTEADRFVGTGRGELPVYTIKLSGQSLADDKFLNFLVVLDLLNWCMFAEKPLA